ncbi:glycosyltransferase family 9 protein [Horticoccus sp. 23ND18S-11]|uniref:glycosyltransferase family 9 protein n=1 Tax=Horticoccus sp. 23ND18S-11 TaxID=3391832 RepID=UPI0039C9FABE
MNASTAPAPRAALILKIDTLGDLIVFAPVLASLRAAWPSTRFCVLIRRAYLDLAPLLVPTTGSTNDLAIEWLTTTLDPFAQGPEADPAEVGRLRELVTALQPDLVAAATSRRNWLEVALAAAAPHARRVALGASGDDEFFATRLRVALGLHADRVFAEQIPVAADEPDWRSNFQLADAVIGQPVERNAPALALDAATLGLTAGFLQQHGLTAGRYVVCAAAGFANVRLKTWPAERFAAALQYLREHYRLPVVLVGHESERAYLDPLLRQLGTGASATLPAAALWIGREGSLPELAALLAHAALFLGNDTGAMHLAAAVGVPVVAIFGGGTWPRFIPAARRGAAVVHPLPCFGCGWDCAFGDAPCLGAITTADVCAALDHALDASNVFRVMTVAHVSAETQTLMGQVARRHRETQAGHLARQHKLEELTALSREKDGEIAALKSVCDEREKTIFILDGHVRNFQAENAAIKADKAVLEKTLQALPADAAKSAQTIADLVVHIRNIEALLKHRDGELKELTTSGQNRARGLHDLEQAKAYGRLLAQKDIALQSLHEGLAARDQAIARLAAESNGFTAALRKLGLALAVLWREKVWRPFDTWRFQRVVGDYWMQLGILRHYAPRPLRWDERLPGPRLPDAALPQVAVVTPSYGQERFVERTLRSVLDQVYPKLVYVVQDGGSRDRSPAIIASHAARLHHWESVPDKGQADAIHRGFAHVNGALGPDDIMAWLNSDDLLAPGSLRFAAEYFARHPDVDVIYGHRIIIDDEDRDVGRWIMPRHRRETLEWIDYVPQETLFWRKRAWDLAGGIDPSFQFALDWDLLARFQQAGCRMVRVPYFLGAFRVHAEQKTSQAIHTTGADEMRRIRTRFHGERQDDFATINRHARHARFWGAITARLHEVGIRW